MSKVKKLMTTLMLFLTLSGTIVEPVSVLAETVNTVETQEVQEDTTATEVVESATEEAETSTTSSDQSTNTKTDQQEKIGESQNANDSPTSETAEEATQPSTEEADQSVYDYLREKGDEMFADGTIVSTNGTSYRDDYLSVIQEVQNMLNPNPIRLRMAKAAGQSVYVNRDYGSSTIGWTYSNGISELGWYAKKDANGGMLWCIEPGVPLNWGANYPYTTSEVSQDKYIRASLAVYYGWEKQKSVVNAFYTERLVQEITTRVTSGSIYDYAGMASQSGYNTFRKNILEEVESFFTLPSFAGKSYTVKLGETLILTDTTGNLPKYKVTADTANMTVSQSGNTLKITPKSDSKESGTLTLRYQIAAEYEGATIIYSAPYLQDVMKARIGDPRFFNVSLNIELQGQGEIIKVDENGKGLAGAQFEITNKTTNKTETKTTDKDGKISGTWDTGTVLEIKEVKAPTGYVLNTEKKTLTIEANKTKSVTFTNKSQLGSISIDKSGVEFGKDMVNGNYTLAGNTFEVYAGSKATGTPVATITTDEKGQAKTKSLPLGTYTLKETAASEGYLLNTNTWTVEITYAGQNVEITNVDQKIENQEQKGSVVLTKQDSETGTVSQGDTTFAGAEFDLFRKSDNKKIGHYTTNDKGQLTVNDLVIDTYYFLETKAPIGYVLDKTPVEFSVEYSGQTASVAKQATAVKKK